MKKTSRKLVVPLIVLALGIAIVSTVGAVENFDQKPGPGPILGHNNNPGQKPGNDDFKFNPGHNVNPGHKPDNDFNQWDKGHDFKSGYHGYWNYPYNWHHQFKPYYNQYNKWYWYYQPWNHHPYDEKKH
ncbi:MAG: hypothetical protein LUQ38_03170 [Methanotrichaceae archaeon]|nr:hypothetical protein [Methanotrichaceae archaeon]